MRIAPALIQIACLSLLGLQLSGLHMHVGADGFDGTPHGTHSHDQDTDGHDHEGDADVSVVELGAGGSKLILFVVWVGLTLLTVLTPRERVSISSVVPLLAGRTARWRPPLRAPPRLALSL